MFSRFIKKKQAPKDPFVNSSKVISLVNELKKKKLLKNQGPIFHIYKELLIGPNKKNIIKNIFFYARLNNLLKDTDTLYLKEMDTEELIAVYTDKSGTVFY